MCLTVVCIFEHSILLSLDTAGQEGGGETRCKRTTSLVLTTLYLSLSAITTRTLTS